MKSKFLRAFSIVLLLAVVLSGFSVPVSAGGYESYTYWNEVSLTGRKDVYNRPMYECEKVLRAKDFGADDVEELIDICVDGDGNIYLLDTKAGIIILDKSYSLIGRIRGVKGEEVLKFVNAKSIYVDANGVIYICDTENARVITCDNQGNLLSVYELPDSPLIPEKFDFKPIRVVADSKGYVYILSEGSYYGALLYAPDKSFMGFYGSNTVTNGILGGVQSLIKRMFPNNKKASNSQRSLPYCFTDIVLDEKDFIYTATDTANKGQIKKLNPGLGTDIMDSKELNFADDKINRTFRNGAAFTQKITGLDINDNGFIYGLDSAYGKIYLYDPEGRIITVFSGGMGNGTKKGTFITASGIAVNKDNSVLVCDKTNNTLTVFGCNDYGKEVLRLTDLTVKGDHLEARKGWEEVLKIDKNLQMAYIGLGRAYLAEGKYQKAMDMALDGYDRETYALAFEYYRNDWLLNNFEYIFIAVVALVAVAFALYFVAKKKSFVLIKNEKLSLALGTSLHPGKCFEEIKDRNKGSMIISAVMILLFYVSAVIQTICGGFMFSSYDPATYNSLWVFVQSAGLIILWAAANWLVCSLAGGKGKLKEIVTVTAYSLLPMIIGRIIWTVLSNFLLPSESAILTIVSAVAIIYTFILLTIGMLRIHEFTMSRFIGTGVLTVLGMAAIVFLLILVGILLQQLGGFVSTVFIEIFM